MESCTDCYYTSVIKTFVEIIKQSETDRQIVLVNTARTLNYLEDFGQRQLQLFTVLEKYHLLPDNLENLQSQFGFLKQATSKNFEHLQQAINVQQTYTANLCTFSPVLQNWRNHSPVRTENHQGARYHPNKCSGL